MSRGTKLSATTPINLTELFSFQVNQIYGLQLQDGTEARLYESLSTVAPVISEVDEEVDDITTAGELEDRPARLANKATVEYHHRDHALASLETQLWAWDEGEGVLAIVDSILTDGLSFPREQCPG